MSINKSIQQRWSGFTSILESLFRGDIVSSPFGVTESGQEDFRGILLETNIRPVGLNLASCDFGFLRAQKLIFAESSIASSSFKGSQLALGDFKSSFLDVSFADSKLRGSGLGANGSSYSGCDFSRSDLSGSTGLGGRFERCQFDKTKWNNSLMGECCFYSCRFTGEIRGVIFGGVHGASMVNCDLSNASFIDCTFNEFRFSDCKSSEDTLLFCDWPKALACFKKEVRTRRDFGAIELATRWIGVWEKRLNITPQNMVDRADLAKQVGPVAGEAIFKVFHDIWQRGM